MTPFNALTGWLIQMSGAEGRPATAERPSRLTDEEPAARGTIRGEATRQSAGAPS